MNLSGLKNPSIHRACEQVLWIDASKWHGHPAHDVLTSQARCLCHFKADPFPLSNMNRVPEGLFGGFVDGFAESWVRVDGGDQLVVGGFHFDG